MLRLAVLLALITISAGAHADTLDYLRTTQVTKELAIAKPKGRPRVVVARSTTEWRAAWTAAGGKGAAPTVDFDRQMILGVVNGAKQDRVLYRIQLDDAAKPTALVAHLGFGDAPTWSGATRKPTGAHFVVTPRSALAVRFVEDAMVDAGLFDATNTGEGVDSTDVATIPAIVAQSKGAAALREHAEAAVIATLTTAEKKRLLVGPLGGALERIPHGWTVLDVRREADRWRIQYDDLAFEVDAATGKVTRK